MCCRRVLFGLANLTFRPYVEVTVDRHLLSLWKDWHKTDLRSANLNFFETSMETDGQADIIEI